ncbi:hypothetical protein [Secundilactobacillus folii]|uniref:DUF2273 domain-containing protein n=1 Tax=Secundilactobacillus folii TaxID=2678357 RepID=A0A7X2XW81_9LACO|nr:hypothetical protein [Secundilactobacillus folii]MTV81426.1 hypothetical protein [Secundilactobacillus folii]
MNMTTVYGGLIGMLVGLVWALGGFNAVLLMLTLGAVGVIIGAVISKFGGLKALISQLVDGE